MASLETHYSVRDIETRTPAALRAAGLDPEQRLSPEELGVLDYFPTGGYRASLKPGTDLFFVERIMETIIDGF